MNDFFIKAPARCNNHNGEMNGLHPCRHVFSVTVCALMLMVLMQPYGLFAQNPIVANKGLNDPHIHIFNDTAYLYASHDKSKDNTRFVMEDWWVWSSPDLVNWTHRSTLKPEDTYIAKPYERCWATDAAYRNGKYYFYFSEGNQQTGVVVGNTPVGPWQNMLSKPLLDSNLTATHEYDPCVFETDGEYYIIFGVWDYYIARLSDDMISLAESPRRIDIQNPRGPYNQDGSNKKMPTDDKPFLHKYNNRYYLSWGAFYATAENVYGPYTYKGTVINETSFAKGYDKPTWPNGFLQGRHGSFFTWHGQNYFAYCDISQTGNRYFRDTFISYVHYKDNGEIAPVRVDGTGVGNYNADVVIEAEDFFLIRGATVVEGNKGFVVKSSKEPTVLVYPNCRITAEKSEIQLTVKIPEGKGATVNIYSEGDLKKRLTQLKMKGRNNSYNQYKASIKLDETIKDLAFEIISDKGVWLDKFSLH